MTIRKLTQAECKAYDLLSHVCFAFEAEKDYEEKYKEEKAKDWENKIGGFDENGKLIAALYIIPYSMNFDGHVVKMGGIQAVVTAPEARGTGVMPKIMTESLHVMKEQGQIFSLLYPFSSAYYRKFGYETAYQQNCAEIPIANFGIYPFPKDSVRFLEKDGDLSDMKKVYDVFKQGRNYAIDRDDIEWQDKKRWDDMMKDDPYIHRRYSYINYNSKGKPNAYMISKAGEDSPVRILEIIELAWSDKAGLYAMLGFIGGLRPRFDRVHWLRVPQDVDVYSIFAETSNDVKVRNTPSAMTRIVDLPEVLKRMKPPQGQGRVVIDVVDKSMPCNTGKYAISWKEGALTAEESNDSPDISTSIETLAQLVVGYTTPEEATYRRDTTIHKQTEALNNLFHKKNLYLWEAF